MIKSNNDTILGLDEFTLKTSDEVMLGITIDRKLIFSKYIKSLCEKTGQKASSLSPISPYLHEN